MKRNLLIGMMAIGLLSLAMLAVYVIRIQDAGKPLSGADANPSAIVDVDEVARHPDRFRGTIGVTGKVSLVDETQSAFILGCADACVRVPVKYTGDMPSAQSDVTVYGEIQEAEEGRYILVAQDVKSR